MEKNSNHAEPDIKIDIPLIDTGSNDNEENSNSFIRRSTFIQAIENDYSQDEHSLIDMGYDSRMIKKVYLFLKPNNINEAIELMSEVNGIYQHDYYESKNSSNINHCYICKKERQFHRDYEEEESKNKKNKNILIYKSRYSEGDAIAFRNSNKKNKKEEGDSKEECLICLEEYNENEGNHLQCGHFCCENCLFNYLKTEILSSKVAKLQCFVRDCDFILSEDFILKKLKEDKVLIDKYKIFKQRVNIFLDKDKKFCPEPDCNSYLQKGKDKFVQCENGHQYCYVCLKKWHGKSKCDEELDKDFQIWKEGKVVKQCPRCKIYTEKNEGCNHMTCTECKYQWCWLCEGKYEEGHFASGTCDGLQFAKINYLSEKKAKPNIGRFHYREEDRQTGCCLCVDNIEDKLYFIDKSGPFGLYHGNKCWEYTVSLLVLMFLLVPIGTVLAFFEIPDIEHPIIFRTIFRVWAVLIAIMLYIAYQLFFTQLFIIYVIITAPCKSLSVLWQIEDENDFSFSYY